MVLHSHAAFLWCACLFYFFLLRVRPRARSSVVKGLSSKVVVNWVHELVKKIKWKKDIGMKILWPGTSGTVKILE